MVDRLFPISCLLLGISFALAAVASAQPLEKIQIANGPVRYVFEELPDGRHPIVLTGVVGSYAGYANRAIDMQTGRISPLSSGFQSAEGQMCRGEALEDIRILPDGTLVSACRGTGFIISNSGRFERPPRGSSVFYQGRPLGKLRAPPHADQIEGLVRRELHVNPEDAVIVAFAQGQAALVSIAPQTAADIGRYASYWIKGEVLQSLEEAATAKAAADFETMSVTVQRVWNMLAAASAYLDDQWINHSTWKLPSGLGDMDLQGDALLDGNGRPLVYEGGPRGMRVGFETEDGSVCFMTYDRQAIVDTYGRNCGEFSRAWAKIFGESRGRIYFDKKCVSSSGPC